MNHVQGFIKLENKYINFRYDKRDLHIFYRCIEVYWPKI